MTRWTYSEVGGLDTIAVHRTRTGGVPDLRQRAGRSRRHPRLGLQTRRRRARGRSSSPSTGARKAKRGPPSASTYQLWLSKLGAAVIVPNVRGSERLRQALPVAGQRLQARGLGQGHRRPAGLDRDPAGPRREPGGRLRRQLRRVHGAGQRGALQRSAESGGRHRRHQQLRDLSRKHPGLPPGSAARRVRGRTRPGHAGPPGKDQSAEQRRQDQDADDGGAGRERSARAGDRGGPGGGSPAGQRPAGVVHERAERGPRLSQEGEPRHLPAGDHDVSSRSTCKDASG